MLDDGKGISPVIATTIVTIVTVFIAIVVALWMTGIIGLYTAPSIEVKVKVKIYSINYNIGILNEDAVFDIFIHNLGNYSSLINIIIKAEDLVLLNETVYVEPKSSKNLTYSKKLLYTGLWTIQLFAEGKMIYGYSFVTMINKAEADIRINQLNDILLNRVTSITAIIISIASLIINLKNIGKKEKTNKNYITKDK